MLMSIQLTGKAAKEQEWDTDGKVLTEAAVQLPRYEGTVQLEAQN